ncbi:MAG TPA: hypothetical protein VL688_06810 [Verrucomicrobiae bacterium]|jgi:hypothetical protein|nr:hypothetical protein [Verrucomicrobiae bacterium]
MNESSPKESLTAALSDILQKLAALEKKIDLLAAASRQAPSRAPRPFSRDSKPHFHRKDRGRDFRRPDSKPRAPRPPKAPEVGVFIRTNLRGEHYANKPKPGI